MTACMDVYTSSIKVTPVPDQAQTLSSDDYQEIKEQLRDSPVLQQIGNQQREAQSYGEKMTDFFTHLFIHKLASKVTTNDTTRTNYKQNTSLGHLWIWGSSIYSDQQVWKSWMS